MTVTVYFGETGEIVRKPELCRTFSIYGTERNTEDLLRKTHTQRLRRCDPKDPLSLKSLSSEWQTEGLLEDGGHYFLSGSTDTKRTKQMMRYVPEK